MSSLPMPHAVWIALDQVIVTEISIPLAFTEDDILHYVFIEQAQLFPTLNQEIYFDFLVKEVAEENKKIIIVACNMNDFSDLAPTVQFLKIDHKDFEAFNLLPWRQRSKKLVKKRQLKFLIGVVVFSSLLMFIIDFFYVQQSHQDKLRAKSFSHRKHVIVSKLSALEKSNQEIQALVSRWKNKIDTAHYQSELEGILATVETQRPANTVIEKMIWKNNVLLMEGVTKEASMVKAYLDNLMRNKIPAHLKSMSYLSDHEFPVQFEIESERLLI